MKTFAILASLAATALAQNAFVNLPEGKELQAGDEVTVQVTRPNSLTGSTEFGIAIGLQTCGEGRCIDSNSVLGLPLYTGPFSPIYHENYNPPYENFTVTIPETATKGPAVVAVAHAALVGAANWPFFEVVNTTATIV
ncbi:hypothetical protein BDV12DRAFT_175125 [Aspergillus spectabilis]